jgi:hypothetical protein
MAFRQLHSDEIKEMWHRQVMAQEKSAYAVMDVNDDRQNPLGR